jgi:uridine kinase
MNNFVIGIGGISSSGKSSIADKLQQRLNAKVLRIDEYLTEPNLIFDTNIDKVIENYEDISCYNLQQFYEDLVEAKKSYKVTIAEGFLLYDREDITKLIDLKVLINIDKQHCNNRLKTRINRQSDDYYFDNYVWKLFTEKKYNFCK